MLKNDEKLGVFIVPTGIGASIGGYAGDASSYARKFAQKSKLIVNPNVVNAGGFSGITSNMYYVEGFSLDSFFKDEIGLMPSENNKTGIVFDKAIPQDVLNIHINTFNAVKTVYGIDIIGYEITEKDVGVKFAMSQNNISTGSVENPETLLDASKKLINKGADAIALVCMFDEPDNFNPNYSDGRGTDPVGGVEAVISHYISKELLVPCAHSPAFADYKIYPDIVDAKSAAEYITPTFLPCILLGLSQAPKFSKTSGIRVADIDFLVMPYDSAGSVPVFEASKRNIDIYFIKENKTALDVTPEKIALKGNIKIFDTYEECLNFI